MGNHQNIINVLIGRGMEALNHQREIIPFTDNNEANLILNNIEQYPYLFILGCIADRRMRSESCWIKPYDVCQEIESFYFNDLRQITPQEWNQQVQHFAGNITQYFHRALEHIENVYNGQAQQIWSGNPNCATVVRRLLEFNGIGVKIANMGTNILLRDFKVQMQNLNTIDMPVDVNVTRVFKRLNLVREDIPKNKTTEIIVYTARELYPDYPAVFDKGVWEVGKYWCRKEPSCQECYMNEHCPTAAQNEV